MTLASFTKLAQISFTKAKKANKHSSGWGIYYGHILKACECNSQMAKRKIFLFYQVF